LLIIAILEAPSSICSEHLNVGSRRRCASIDRDPALHIDSVMNGDTNAIEVPVANFNNGSTIRDRRRRQARRLLRTISIKIRNACKQIVGAAGNVGKIKRPF